MRVQELWTEVRFARAEIHFDREDFDDSKDDVDSRSLLGKIQLKRQKLMEATEVEFGSSSGDKETFFLRQFGDDKTKFRGEVATSLGAPNPGDNTLQVIGDDEVTHLRSGVKAHMGKDDNYTGWKALQARAGKVLLKVHKPEEVPIPGFDPLDLE